MELEYRVVYVYYCMKFSGYVDKITPVGIEKEWEGVMCEKINGKNDCPHFIAKPVRKKWLGIF
jgi:hypothetical protein